MSDEAKTSPESAASADSFSLADISRRRVSSLNDPAWRWSLGASLLGLVAWGVHRLLGGDVFLAIWAVALLAAGAWFCAVRLLLLDTRARRFWMVWVILGLIPLAAAGPDPDGRYIALGMSSVFLLCRRYRPYRHLTSVRRAVVFGLGILALLAVSLGWAFPFGGAESPAHGLVFGRQVWGYAVGSLRLFWVFSLVHLFFGMRLHFLRLKPKLAVSGLFIAAFPALLLVIFGLVALYGTLGSSRATRAKAVCDDWLRLAARSQTLAADSATVPPATFAPDSTSSPFTVSFAWRREKGRPVGRGQIPDWVPRLEESLAAEAPPDTAEVAADEAAWVPCDTTAYFCVGEQMWLLNLQGVGTDDLRIDGFQFDEQVLDRLSVLFQADAGLYSNRNLVVDEEDPSRTLAAQADSTYGRVDIRGRLDRDAPADSSVSFFEKKLGFGGALFEVIRLGADGLYLDDVFLHLQVSLAGLGREFVTGERNLNQVIVAVLGLLAGLFLLLEAMALFLGIRITSGITSAVRLLHAGTRRLATGDLDTRIEIPNQDEFGDLALSFNEMTRAVKKGREEAVARERLERELETAREIQERLLPHETPAVPGFEITGTSLPSRQVGGDYYDFLAQDNGRHGIAIGDVSGKGIPAALLMSNLQASLQGQVIHPSSVSEVVSRVNDLLVRSTDPHMFATFFYGVLDCREGTFTVSNAGHNPPIVLRASGAVEHLEANGIPLGWLPDQQYEQQTVHLAEGDVVVLYTDGITEAVGPPDQAEGEPHSSPVSEEEAAEDPENMFGEEALLTVITENANASAPGIKDAILAAVAAHTAGIPQSDDITLVVIKRLSA